MTPKFNSMQVLPENYHLTWKLDMRESKRLIFANGLGLLVLLIIFPLTYAFAAATRPEASFSFSLNGLSGILNVIVLILALGVMLLVHEGIHGVFIWIFTGSRPKFALKTFYAYAAAPGWYLSKWPYFITAIAPLILITALGLIGITLAPFSWVFPIMLIIIFNASGAVGDAWVAAALLFRKNSVMAQDDGDVVSFYEPA